MEQNEQNNSNEEISPKEKARNFLRRYAGLRRYLTGLTGGEYFNQDMEEFKEYEGE